MSSEPKPVLPKDPDAHKMDRAIVLGSVGGFVAGCAAGIPFAPVVKWAAGAHGYDMDMETATAASCLLAGCLSYFQSVVQALLTHYIPSTPKRIWTAEERAQLTGKPIERPAQKETANGVDDDDGA